MPDLVTVRGKVATQSPLTAEEQDMLQLAINDHEQLQALRGQMGAFDWKALLAKLFPALSAIPQLAPLIAIAQAILALLKVLPQPSPSPSPTPGDDTIPPVPLSS